jgi:hypothetical protein
MKSISNVVIFVQTNVLEDLRHSIQHLGRRDPQVDRHAVIIAKNYQSTTWRVSWVKYCLRLEHIKDKTVPSHTSVASFLLVNESSSGFCERCSDSEECFSKLNLKTSQVSLTLAVG